MLHAQLVAWLDRANGFMSLMRLNVNNEFVYVMFGRNVLVFLYSLYSPTTLVIHIIFGVVYIM